MPKNIERQDVESAHAGEERLIVDDLSDQALDRAAIPPVCICAVTHLGAPPTR